MASIQESKTDKSVWQELFDFSNSCLGIVIIILSINAVYNAILKGNISYIQIALVYFLMLVLGSILLYPINRKINDILSFNVLIKHFIYSTIFAIGMFLFDHSLFVWGNAWILFVPQIAMICSAFLLFPVFILFKSILSIKDSEYLKEIIEKVKKYNYIELKNKYVAKISLLKKQAINFILKLKGFKTEIKIPQIPKLLFDKKKLLIKTISILLFLIIGYGIFSLIKYIGIINILKFIGMFVLSVFVISIIIGAFVGNSAARFVLSFILKIVLVAIIIYCSPYILAILILLALAWLYGIFKILFK